MQCLNGPKVSVNLTAHPFQQVVEFHGAVMLLAIDFVVLQHVICRSGYRVIIQSKFVNALREPHAAKMFELSVCIRGKDGKLSF